jgi:hypothetical protein
VFSDLGKHERGASYPKKRGRMSFCSFGRFGFSPGFQRMIVIGRKHRPEMRVLAGRTIRPNNATAWGCTQRRRKGLGRGRLIV